MAPREAIREQNNLLKLLFENDAGSFKTQTANILDFLSLYLTLFSCILKLYGTRSL